VAFRGEGPNGYQGGGGIGVSCPIGAAGADCWVRYDWIIPPIDGWTFLVDQTWGVLDDERTLAQLGAGTWLLTFCVDEHSTGFGTTCWTDGGW
jgi:hypothetical protein